jgi:3-oxoadipate enol-lactonase
MSFASVNGGVVHYLDEGPRDAPVMAFINSLGTDLRIWDEVAGILSGDFRIVRYDKRGHASPRRALIVTT